MVKKKQKFGIRKTSIGVGSVLLGLTLMGANAQAEELNNEPEKLEWVSSDLEVEVETAEIENTGIDEIDLNSIETPAEAQLKEGSNTLNFKVSSDVSTTTSTKEVETDAFMIFGASEGMRAYNTELQELGNYVLDNTPESMDYILMEYRGASSITWEYSPLTNDRSKLKAVVGSYENTDVYGLKPSKSTEQFPDADSKLLSLDGEFGDTYSMPGNVEKNSENRIAIIFDVSENMDDLVNTLDGNFKNWVYAHDVKVIPIIFGQPTEHTKIVTGDGFESEDIIYVQHDLSPIKTKLKEVLQKVTTKTVTSTPDVVITVSSDNPEAEIKETILVSPDGSEKPVTLSGGKYTFKPTVDGDYKFKYKFGGKLNRDANVTSNVTVGGNKVDNKADHLVGLVVENGQETETEPIPFKKETRNNPNLPKGETKVVQQGRNGVKTIYYNVRKENGAIVDKVKDREEVTLEPTAEITEVGTKSEKERVETRAVPNNTVERNDFSLMKGETKRIEGSEGIRTIVYTEVYDGDKKVSETVKSDNVTKDPVDTIILVGTKEIRERVEVVPIPNKTVEKRDFSMMVGERKEIIGHLGIKTIVHEEIYDGSALNSTKVLREEVNTQPVDTIILIGTKEIKQRVEKQPVPFKRIQKKTPDLLVGDSRVFKGIVGERTIIHEEVYNDGVLDSTKVISDEVTTAPKDEVEWIGVKEFKHRNERIAIDYGTERVETEELLIGEERLKQTGVDGYEVVYYQETWIDGKLVKTEETKRERVEAIPEIIEVGIKEPEPEVHEPEECPDPMPVGELPKAGEHDMLAVMGVAGATALSGVGLLVSGKRKEEN